MRTKLWTFFSLVAITGMAVVAAAQEPCIPGCAPAGCNACGTPGHCCRMVTEMVPIKKVVYTSKCVPVCEVQPGCHSCRGGHGGGNCCDTGCGNGNGQTCKLFYKNVLIKKEIVIGHKCVTKCVVDDGCCVGQ